MGEWRRKMATLVACIRGAGLCVDGTPPRRAAQSATTNALQTQQIAKSKLTFLLAAYFFVVVFVVRACIVLFISIVFFVIV